MSEDDSMLSQGTVDERNEARNPLNAMPPKVRHVSCSRCGAFTWASGTGPIRLPHADDCPLNEHAIPPNTVHSLVLRENPPDEVDDDTIRDLWQAINHLHQLQDTEAISPEAEQRRQESIGRARGEIARLMRS